MLDLRPPFRRRQAAPPKDWLPALFFCVVVVTLGAAGLAKYQRHLQAQRSAVAEESRLAESFADESESQVPVVTTAGGRSYYAAPSEPDTTRREKTTMERYDEALALMDSSRQTRRQLDGKQYSQTSRQQVVAGGYKSNPCESIEAQRARIHEAMRRPYDVRRGEWYRQQLRENHAARIGAGC